MSGRCLSMRRRTPSGSLPSRRSVSAPNAYARSAAPSPPERRRPRAALADPTGGAAYEASLRRVDALEVGVANRDGAARHHLPRDHPPAEFLLVGVSLLVAIEELRDRRVTPVHDAHADSGCRSPCRGRRRARGRTRAAADGRSTGSRDRPAAPRRRRAADAGSRSPDPTARATPGGPSAPRRSRGVRERAPAREPGCPRPSGRAAGAFGKGLAYLLQQAKLLLDDRVHRPGALRSRQRERRSRGFRKTKGCRRGARGTPSCLRAGDVAAGRRTGKRYITPRGFRALQQELVQLLRDQRPRVTREVVRGGGAG